MAGTGLYLVGTMPEWVSVLQPVSHNRSPHNEDELFVEFMIRTGKGSLSLKLRGLPGVVVKCQPHIPEALSSVPVLVAIDVIIYPSLMRSESRGVSTGTSVSTSALKGNSSGFIVSENKSIITRKKLLDDLVQARSQSGGEGGARGPGPHPCWPCRPLQDFNDGEVTI